MLFPSQIFLVYCEFWDFGADLWCFLCLFILLIWGTFWRQIRSLNELEERVSAEEMSKIVEVVKILDNVDVHIHVAIIYGIVGEEVLK